MKKCPCRVVLLRGPWRKRQTLRNSGTDLDLLELNGSVHSAHPHVFQGILAVVGNRGVSEAGTCMAWQAAHA